MGVRVDPNTDAHKHKALRLAKKEDQGKANSFTGKAPDPDCGRQDQERDDACRA